MRLLLTAGPTREYLDDVRFLSNASSGRMGYALAEAAIARGHQVVLVSGPVTLAPPTGCEFHPVETSAQMHDACLQLFPACDGAIGAAAVCDYRPRERSGGKLSKTGRPLLLELVETPDILADLGRRKGDRWIVGFALEAQNARANALRKLQSKNCDAIVLNSPQAIGGEQSSVELIDRSGSTVANWSADKRAIADFLIAWIEAHLTRARRDSAPA
jgi:phosphopantothenoylcysteine decarboxylase/phosphopantothenate--cysteine ligase